MALSAAQLDAAVRYAADQIYGQTNKTADLDAADLEAAIVALDLKYIEVDPTVPGGDTWEDVIRTSIDDALDAVNAGNSALLNNSEKAFLDVGRQLARVNQLPGL